MSTSRNIRNFFARWKFLMFVCCVTYLVVLYIPLPQMEKTETTSRIRFEIKNKEEEDVKPSPKPKVFKFNPVGKEPFDVEEVLTYSPIKLEERLNANVIPGEKRLILSWNAGLSAANLGGCPDWNCEFTNDRARSNEASAVLFSHQDPKFVRKSNQYVIYFSQESPKNAGFNLPSDDYVNMTFGFRHDTPAGSPYGYSVKLGPKSRLEGDIFDKSMILKKKKGAAWFVSHCSTNSKRETFVKSLQKYFPVDIYGGCSSLKCPRNGACEEMLDKDYHFYVAFENSICKDYVTEKLWRQGYQKTIIPLVMKRSLVESFVPPNSFIAIDDFKTVKEMGSYLQYLIDNKTAYMEYFNWRREYKVLFLDGSNHDILERPWGFCQICRMAWTNPLQIEIIKSWQQYWTNSCEADGELVKSIKDQ